MKWSLKHSNEFHRIRKIKLLNENNISITFNGNDISSLISNILTDIIINKLNNYEYFTFVIESYYVYNIDINIDVVKNKFKMLRRLVTNDYRFERYNHMKISILLTNILTDNIFIRLDQLERNDFYDNYQTY
jgi:hypothetical protein